MKPIALAVALLSLSGCVSMGRKLDPDAVAKIKKGDSRETVLQLIGSPDSMTTDGNGGTMYSYSFVRASPHAANFIPIIGPLVGGHDVENQMVLVSFSSSNVVSNLITSYGSTETGIGANAGKHVELKAVEQGKRPQ